jgi:DNA-binding NarL/FixJ family response regulator
MTVRVLLAGCDALYRIGIASFLEREGEMRVVGHTGNLAALTGAESELRPDVILLEFDEASRDRWDVIQRLVEQTLAQPICVLSGVVGGDELVALVRAGVRGLVSKGELPDALVRALLTIAAGGVVVDPYVTARLLDEYRRLSARQDGCREGLDCLTKREREVLALTGQGASNQEIAKTLSIGQNTVKVHERHILEKLNLHNRHHAAAFAAQAGLVTIVQNQDSGADERASTRLARAS